MKNNTRIKPGSLLVLFIICAVSILLVLPTINNNIDDPNMIVYLNADEGGQMDVIWRHYSGERRDSTQWEFDYGLEMRYLADFARLILSRFIEFTPGTFVLILRWFNLIAWILSFFALWHLVKYHFGDKWQPLLAAVLLAVRPVFAYLSISLKPEPVVLLIMIIGLDYTLRIVKEPLKRRNLYISIACASAAFLIKYAGVFLLPAIITSVFLAKRYQNGIDAGIKIFPEFKLAWIVPSLIGASLIVPLFFIIFFYVRKSTGITWYEQSGLWESFLQNKLMFYVFIIGICLILLSPLILYLNKSKNRRLARLMKRINEINSYMLIVCSIFAGFTFLLGFKWIVNFRDLIDTYAQLGSLMVSTLGPAASMITEKGLLYAFFCNLFNKIMPLGPIIYLLFVFYLIMELYSLRQGIAGSTLKLYKRVVLLSFLVFPLLGMCSMLRLAPHHMLPFFAATSILALQGFYMFKKAFKDRRTLYIAITFLISISFAADIFMNSSALIKLRLYQFRQREDVVFDIAEWWHENIPEDSKIVADHYSRVYIPRGYKKIKTLKWDKTDRSKRLREIIDKYHPEFVYYNEGLDSGDEVPIPPLREILPEKRVRLIKSFENRQGRYHSKPGARFVIYRITYENT